ncbi:DNA-(apurinic or apyrimidinic site) lyase APN2 [Aspergillus ruber CBS 135680]|uniref:DNA-(apurinic or apyrimidinic site) endonuclease 2 n=1 Tax=Aspergillus ruber (strain CBS 135680) TaxID=1388766 RepID=A0A017SHU9_ASPRC|nr:DNA lyase Apn2 [Aspergillus ruber CBS 135680]EYE96224.1 DNA lyase Apn2 [Aspergillus ruber CBS 135680]
MGFRITTWNVNGIRNPFSYEPWRGKRSFEAMFDTLEADIVVFQETKIQRKDLRDDMVLVPGWDCYFSLPRVKKGYSGVVIYTRNAKCAPVRAEEGITGVLCPPNTSTPFRELPGEHQIGGYPTLEQLYQFEIEPAVLDSEGRCVILEFPAFVLIGTYCPANRDESRDSFRQNFIEALDTRVRNLVAMGKRVLVTGDLNISRGEIDSAHAGEAIRKGVATEDEFVSAGVRRIFNQLLSDGKVIGERDEGREKPVLYDICRAYHPERRGMYTCWEQRLNARPGNFGARIDYVLCSLDMQEWFFDSNIQEGLLGSDHCPVFATFKDSVTIDGSSVNIMDAMNPPGMFQNGERQQEYSTKYLLPISGRLIPEFDRRRNIKDMFARKPVQRSSTVSTTLERTTLVQEKESQSPAISDENNTPSVQVTEDTRTTKGITRKRNEESQSTPTASMKRTKSMTTQAPAPSTPGQKSLKGFFKPKSSPSKPSATQTSDSTANELPESPSKRSIPSSSQPEDTRPPTKPQDPFTDEHPSSASQESESVIDPIVSKEDWSKLFSKKPPPTCDGHEEPCISLTTKKPGVNCGRAFWICQRPLGPSGNKEKGTQWRCPTFIWASDWNSTAE